MKKIFINLLAIATICAGIWCAQYTVLAQSGCHAHAFDLLCAQTLEHGSIMSASMLVETIALILLYVVLYKTYTYCVQSASYTHQQLYLLQHQSHSIITYLLNAFSNGILHPRKP